QPDAEKKKLKLPKISLPKLNLPVSKKQKNRKQSELKIIKTKVRLSNKSKRSAFISKLLGKFGKKNAAEPIHQDPSRATPMQSTVMEFDPAIVRPPVSIKVSDDISYTSGNSSNDGDMV
ncbi:MAG: hypothetical protein RR273_01865, partial [Oscillospiraceae bacterium]